MSSAAPLPPACEASAPGGDRQEIAYRPLHPAKRAAAWMADRLGLAALGRWGLGRSAAPYLRIVNYHDTIERYAAGLEAQLTWYARTFVPVGPAELDDLLRGHWPHQRPGLLISFDDAWACQARVAAPLLERHGWRGWFFLPVGFLDEPRASFVLEQPRGRELAPMTWEMVRELDRRGHTIGSHTYSHHVLPPGTPAETIEQELVHSRRRLEAELGHPATAFSWVWGREGDYHPATEQALVAAGYQTLFLTTPGVVRPGDDRRRLPRTNVEARFPPALVHYQLSGIPDWLGKAKRRRIERRLRGE